MLKGRAVTEGSVEDLSQVSIQRLRVTGRSSEEVDKYKSTVEEVVEKGVDVFLAMNAASQRWYEESGAAGGLLEKQEHLELLKKWRRVRKKCNKMVGLAIKANAIHSAWLYKHAIHTLESLPAGLCEMD